MTKKRAEANVVRRMVIPIGTRNVCVFDFDFARQSREFLAGLDPEYYAFVAKRMLPILKTDDCQRAAVTLRMTYSQALENLFALIAAANVSFETIPHWLALYYIKDLREIVNEIRTPTVDGKRRSPSKNPFHKIASQVLESKQWDEETITGFADMWRAFSKDFVDTAHDREYNSFKHGFRARSGGYTLSMGLEETPGVPAKPEAMRVVGHSEFGSRTYDMEVFLDEKGEPIKNNFRLHAIDRNWAPKKYVEGLPLLSMSIRNLISYFQEQLGVDPKIVSYSRPRTSQAYLKPWSYDVGVQLTGFQRHYQLNKDAFLTKAQMRAALKKPNV
ncbi:MAG: hypothetical protein M3R13_02180 [Armatimonadota bacterium]|nr:hypothetical protein [Armatimonadota bacterium]